MPSEKSLTRRVLPYLPLLLPVFFYLAIILFWQSQDIYGLTGDEPHYLLIADSLYRDHDLYVDNNYLIETPVQKACRANLSDPLDIPRHVRNRFSMHNIGLPLLLLIPYSIAGVSGAKIFMTLLAGFWPYLLYKAAFQIIESRPWSILIALTLSIGLPYLPVSNQLYIDLLGGMIILYAAERVVGLLRGHYEPSASPAKNLCMGLLLGFLPWLHIRLSAPALLLLLGYVYASGVKPSTAVAANRRRLLLPVAVFIASGIVLAAYNQVAFGNAIFGPYYGYLSFDVRKIILTFIGLHWDMAHGIFMQQPLLILSLAGIVPFVKENWKSCVLLLLVAVSVLLPNSMLSVWYGGASFYGRYNWAIVSLWVFPLAYAVKLLFKYRKTFILPLCLCSILLQGWMASRWLFDDGLLINTGWPAWAAKNFYSYNVWLLLRLPFFKNVNDYENLSYCLRQPSNYICLLLSALLVVSGWLWLRAMMRTLVMLWSIFLVAAGCAIMLIPPATPFWSVTPDFLLSQIGSLNNRSRVAKDGETRQGYLIYGPYLLLLTGEYEATLEYEFVNSSTAPAPQFDVVYDSGRKVAARTDLPLSSATGGKFKCAFSVDDTISMNMPFEFRVWYGGTGTLTIKRLTVAYLSP